MTLTSNDQAPLARFGRTLATLRKQAGLTQDDLAEHMRAAGHATWLKQTVSRSEHGVRPPNLLELQTLAARFGVTLTQLSDPGTPALDLAAERRALAASWEALARSWANLAEDYQRTSDSVAEHLLALRLAGEAHDRRAAHLRELAEQLETRY